MTGQVQDHPIPIEPIHRAVAAGCRAVAKHIRPKPGFDETPDGSWTTCRYPLSPLVYHFRPLRLKRGWTVRAYRYTSFMGGHLVPFAFPSNQDLPPREACTRRGPTLRGDEVVPDDAIGDFITVVVGDGSPLSYALASILYREIGEVGAWWHGLRWSPYTLLDRDPWDPPLREGSERHTDEITPIGRWSWYAQLPTSWSPEVWLGGDAPVVRFHAYTRYGHERLVRFEDAFTGDGMAFRTTEKVIAEGGRGYSY